MIVYVVFNINGDIIGVANNPERAVEIYLDRHGFEDDDAYNLATSDQVDYLMSLGNPRIATFIMNEFYYA